MAYRHFGPKKSWTQVTLALVQWSKLSGFFCTNAEVSNTNRTQIRFGVMQ